MQKYTGNIYSYLVVKHKGYEYKNNWLRIPVCPFCGSEEKFGINIARDFAHCFRCEYKASVLGFVKDVEMLRDTGEALTLVKAFTQFDYSPLRVEPRQEIDVVLPEGYTNIRRGKKAIGTLARKYILGRNFSIEALGKKGIGYVARVEEELYGYIIIPFYKGRKPIYYQTRRFITGSPKYKNPTVDDLGIGKQQLIYNIDALSKYKELDIYEGAFNALTMGASGTAIQGKVISNWQLTKYLKSKASILNVCLDQDAIKYSFAQAMKLVPYKKVRIVVFPEGQDANDLGKERTREIIESTPILSSTSGIIINMERYYESRKIRNN